jgi:hypothetical protein
MRSVLVLAQALEFVLAQEKFAQVKASGLVSEQLLALEKELPKVLELAQLSELELELVQLLVRVSQTGKVPPQELG